MDDVIFSATSGNISIDFSKSIQVKFKMSMMGDVLISEGEFNNKQETCAIIEGRKRPYSSVSAGHFKKYIWTESSNEEFI